jgi:hypothetical protein
MLCVRVGRAENKAKQFPRSLTFAFYVIFPQCLINTLNRTLDSFFFARPTQTQSTLRVYDMGMCLYKVSVISFKGFMYICIYVCMYACVNMLSTSTASYVHQVYTCTNLSIHMYKSYKSNRFNQKSKWWGSMCRVYAHTHTWMYQHMYL